MPQEYCGFGDKRHGLTGVVGCGVGPSDGGIILLRSQATPFPNIRRSGSVRLPRGMGFSKSRKSKGKRARADGFI